MPAPRTAAASAPARAARAARRLGAGRWRGPRQGMRTTAPRARWAAPARPVARHWSTRPAHPRQGRPATRLATRAREPGALRRRARDPASRGSALQARPPSVPPRAPTTIDATTRAVAPTIRAAALRSKPIATGAAAEEFDEITGLRPAALATTRATSIRARLWADVGNLTASASCRSHRPGDASGWHGGPHAAAAVVR